MKPIFIHDKQPLTNPKRLLITYTIGDKLSTKYYCELSYEAYNLLINRTA